MTGGLAVMSGGEEAIAAIAVGAGTLLVGLLTCRLALRLVTRLRLWDLPNERSSHERPVPRGGGIGILLALVPGAAASLVLFGPVGAGAREVGALAAAVVLVLVVGWMDDRRGAGPAAKLLLQLTAALLVVLLVGRVDGVDLPAGLRVELGVLAGPLTVFWLVGFSNGFNFMDGTDGIAALHAGVATAALAALGMAAGTTAGVWLAIPLAGASLAFLSVNWSPARVFMGDSGSLPVGFLLAAIAVLASGEGGVPFMASFLVLGPFLFDTVFTLLRRLSRGENVLTAHRSHLYQRLVISGMSHRSVALLYGAWTLLSGGLGMMYLAGGTRIRSVSVGGALFLGAAVVVYVGFREKVRGGYDS